MVKVYHFNAMVTATFSFCSCFFGFRVEGKIGFREGLCLPSIRSPLSFARPTPLYFMDEIDAALDFRNVSIIANYIKDLTSVLPLQLASQVWA